MAIVQPPQINLQQFQPQAPGPNFAERLFSGIGSGVQGVIAAMAEREKLEREKQEFESKQAYYKTLRTGNELENEQKRQGLAEGKRKLKAKSAAVDTFTKWSLPEELGGGGSKWESAGRFTAGISDPDASQEFLERVNNYFQGQNQAALAQGNLADAKVKTETTDERIGQAENDATVAGVNARVATGTEAAQIAQPGVDLDYKKSLAREARARAAALTAPARDVVDPQVGNAMMNTWKAGGITRADAAKMYGVTLPAGVDPEEKAQTPGGMGAADKRRNEASTLTAKAADQVINQLTNSGIRIGKLTPLVAGTKLGEMALSADEQQLLQANRQFAQMYGLFVTGQASSEPELQRILRTVVPAAGDKPGVLQQKAIMRQVIVQAMETSYGQGKPASEALLNAVKAAQDMGVPNDAVKFLHTSALDANNAEIRAQRNQAKSPILAPMTNWQPMDYDSVMGAFDFGGSAR